MAVSVAISSKNIYSFNNIARDICSVNGLNCKFVYAVIPGTYIIPGTHDLFVGSASEVGVGDIRAKVYYIVVDTQIDTSLAPKIKRACSNAYCISVTKTGAELLERYDIPVAEVVPHGYPLPEPKEPNNVRPINIMYLNHSYQVIHSTKRTLLDRKGWHLWPKIAEAFKNSVAFTSADIKAKNVVVYKNWSLEMIYRLMLGAKVYASLSLSEGFSMNVLMALASGARVVAWDLPVFRELYDGIYGITLVPATEKFTCLIPVYTMVKIDCYQGDINEFIDALSRTLNNFNESDWRTVRDKFNPFKLYRVIGEYIVKR